MPSLSPLPQLWPQQDLMGYQHISPSPAGNGNLGFPWGGMEKKEEGTAEVMSWDLKMHLLEKQHSGYVPRELK